MRSIFLLFILFISANSTFDFEWQGNEQHPTNYYNYYNQQDGQYNPYYFQNNNYDQFNRNYYSNFGQNQWNYNQQWSETGQRPFYLVQSRPVDYRQQFFQQRPTFNPYRRAQFPINDNQFIANSNQQAKIQVPTTTPAESLHQETQNGNEELPKILENQSSNQSPNLTSNQTPNLTLHTQQTEVQPSQVENEEDETSGFGENSALKNGKSE